jgi:hypothetical protein
MKLLLLLLMAATAHAAVPPDCDETRFLAAVQAKEQGGEGNAYGLTAPVWKQHMEGWPYYVCAEQPNMARHCAIKHLNWLANELAKAKIHPGPYELGAAWNVGLAGFIKLHRLHVEVQYGREIANLYGAP